MKKIIPIAILSILTLPFISSALTVRTEHRSSSGGATASEGSATVTGDQNSSVNVQTVISGSHGTVQVTTEKDGVTTTETHTIGGSGNDGTVISTPAPEPTSSGRPQREPRGTIAVNTSASANQTGIHSTVNATAVSSAGSQSGHSSVLAIVSTGQGNSVHSFSDLNVPMPVMHPATPTISSNSFSTFFVKIFSIFGFGG